MTTWFRSDDHFLHKKILEYTGRPFDSLDHMAETLVANHNAVVDPEDTVYFLGDVSMGNREQGLAYVNRMNGNKILVCGNHDHVHPMYSQTKRDKWYSVYREHFDAIVWHVTLQIGGIGSPVVTLNHFPFEGDHVEDRYNEAQIAKWRPSDNGQWLLHGHVHSPEVVFGERMIHVGIDADYTSFGIDRYHPIPMWVIEEIIGES